MSATAPRALVECLGLLQLAGYTHVEDHYETRSADRVPLPIDEEIAHCRTLRADQCGAWPVWIIVNDTDIHDSAIYDPNDPVSVMMPYRRGVIVPVRTAHQRLMSPDEL